jgi:pimeloyl-ACP methyl ester carboxylesterase
MIRVLGHDLLALLDALDIAQAVLAGYDWGGRAACVVAALWPERVRALVSVNGYNIQNIARAQQPAEPEAELRYWYQFYFQTERGRAGLAQHRAAYCELLWKLWSPSWRFDAETYRRSAASFDNPDFVEIVIHSYRHRYGLVPGDPSMLDVEARLALQPDISMPTITLDGIDDGVMGPGGTASHARHFTARHEHRLVPGAGHNLPQEAPAAFAQAVLDAAAWAGVAVARA